MKIDTMKVVMVGRKGRSQETSRRQSSPHLVAGLIWGPAGQEAMIIDR